MEASPALMFGRCPPEIQAVHRQERYVEVEKLCVGETFFQPFTYRRSNFLFIPYNPHPMQRTLRIAALALLTVAALSSCGTVYNQCAAYAETPTAETR